jgi:hypothetical protein
VLSSHLLGETKEITKKLGQDDQLPYRVSNRTSPECKSEDLLADPVRSVTLEVNQGNVCNSFFVQ